MGEGEGEGGGGSGGRRRLFVWHLDAQSAEPVVGSTLWRCESTRFVEFTRIRTITVNRINDCANESVNEICFTIVNIIS